MQIELRSIDQVKPYPGNPRQNDEAVRALQYSSLAGENVLDLFGGSGSTLIAAEQTGRHAFLMELDEPYCDVIVQRWEKFTGRKAQRITAAGAPGTDMPEKTPAVAAGVNEAEGK